MTALILAFLKRMVFNKGGAVVLVLLLAVGGGAVLGWKARGPEVTKAKAETADAKAALVTAQTNAAARVAAVELESIKNVTAADESLVKATAALQLKTQEVIHEIPVLIPPQVDRSYPLPNGLVCVCDEAAASGYPSSPETPEPTCQSPGDPSPIAASDLANWITTVCSDYYASRAQNLAWQNYYKAQQETFNRAATSQ